MEWSEEMVDLRQELSDQQIKQLNQIVYPTATFLSKNYRYVSGVTYDCVNAVWNRIVSVPFMYPNGEIRYVKYIIIFWNAQSLLVFKIDFTEALQLYQYR
jgi:hypothetical protein